MFTGLVQSIGIIEKRDRDRLVIHCPDLVANIAIGDSVAVNGVCLTATYISDTNFVADVSPETLGRTNFGDRKLKYVNLETALAVGDKIGGHFVSGHIDGMGKLSDRVLIGNSWELSFEAIPDVARYIVFKGSIAINGISLTISYCNDSGTNFRVAVIPHTYENLVTEKPRVELWRFSPQLYSRVSNSQYENDFGVSHSFGARNTKIVFLKASLRLAFKKRYGLK